MNPRLPPEFLTQPIAHRALHDKAAGRPENSRAAILAAVEHGYGIEIDLQLSADVQAMVFHDYDLDRLTGHSGTVRQLASQDLGRITLSGGADGIPSFAEVLKLVGGRVPLLIELKDQDGAMGPNVGPLERAAASALEGYAGPAAVMSFNPHSVAMLATLAQNVPRGLTTAAFDPAGWPLDAETCAHLRQIADYDRVGATFISHDSNDLASDRVAELKSLGADILCWTIKSPKAEAEARKVAQNVTFEGYLAAHGS